MGSIRNAIWCVVAVGCGRIDFDVARDATPPDSRCLASSIHFAAPVIYPIAPVTDHTAIADIDHDGILDVATSSNAGTSLLFGTGGGALASPVSTPTPVGQNGFALGDLDGDGNVDVVISGGTQFCVFRNHGDRTLEPCVMYPTGMDANSLAVGRLDAGPSLDIVVGNQIDNRVGVYLNSGTGTFPNVILSSTGGTNVVAEWIADFDGDGFGDLVAANLLSQNVAFLKGSATGLPGAPSTFPSGVQPQTLAAGDLDGDGDLDIVAGTLASLDVFVDQGGGSFAPRMPLATTDVVPAGDNTKTRGVVLGDFDGDGDLDIACTNPVDGTVSVFVNTNGTFVAGPVIPIGTNPSGIATGDLDGNGLSDLAVTARDDGTLVVLLAQCR
jgi:hypothetical protein